MCYYNGQKVSREEYIRLKHLEKQVLAHQKLQDVVNGFNYGDSLMIKPSADRRSFEVVEAHWEFIPSWVQSMDELKLIREGINPRTGEKRKPVPWLNAKGENILVNEQGKPSMFREAALKRRCLVPSSGFYEWKEVKKKRYPHHVTLENGKAHFFMAGIWQPWTDHKTGETMDTYAIVTTKANALMEEIHNVKKRMPTILTEELAHEWLFGTLSEERISEVATYQFPSELMRAKPIHKDFLTRENPTQEYRHPELVDLFTI